MRTMVATAIEDGTIDPAQRATLTAQMQRAGLGTHESAFLDEAIKHPASPEEIARAVGDNTQLAAQVVAAANLVANPANAKEQEFVSHLSGELGIACCRTSARRFPVFARAGQLQAQGANCSRSSKE